MAVDPLAGTSKPLPPRDVLESRVRKPLQFAATLVPTDALETLHHELQPRIRTREIERVPGVPLAGDIPGSVNEAKDEIARLLQDVKRLNLGPTSGDAHSSARPLTFPYNTGKVGSPLQGSPEWLESRISALIFDADTSITATGGDAATLDLSGLQMRVLSDKIGELQDMTRLAKRSYEHRTKGPSYPQTQLGASGKRQFKRYTSAPVTSSGNMSGGLLAQPPASNAPMAPTPRTVSGPSQTAPAYPLVTERSQPLVRARSGLHRELSSISSTSSASSAPGPAYARQGMSRHSSRGSVSAFGEGDSFASTTSTVFSSLSEESGASATTLVEEEEEGDDHAFEGRALDKVKTRSSFPSSMDPKSSGMMSSSQRTTSSPLWHFKKTTRQLRDQTQNVRTFNRSSSAMIPLAASSGSSIGPSLGHMESPSRRAPGNKTVSFAHLGVGANHSPLSSSSSASHLAPTSDTVRSSQEWSRSASGTWNPVEKTTWKGSSRGDVQLILSNNMLTCLPCTLFQVTNLVVLTLRHNQLTELPGAINELKNLKELNKTLPPAILDLENLEQFTFVNTELERSPDPTKVQLYASGRKLEPLIVRRSGIASLRSIALSVLLSSRLPHNLPPILTSIDWEPSPEERGTRNALHGLHNASTLASRVRCLTMAEARAMIAAARAAYRHSSSSRKHDDGIPNPAFSGAMSSPSADTAGSMATGAGVEGEPYDDAAANPYFSPCPNPAHSGVFTRKLYLDLPAVERIEWTRVNGADKEVPILWKGCSAECLDFLEAVVGDNEEVLSDTDVEDGFDADVLGGDDPF